MDYPHLIETTRSDSLYMEWGVIAPGFTYDDLTPEEKRVFNAGEMIPMDGPDEED